MKHPRHFLRSALSASLLLSCLVQPFLARQADATSIVCLRSPDSIVIAADSMLTVRNGNSTSARATECKILGFGRVFFSLSGFYKDPARGYDVVQTVDNAIEAQASFRDTAASVSRAVAESLQAELVRLRSEAPAAFNEMKSRGGSLLNLLLTGFENGTPQVVLLKFRQESAASEAVALSVERSACPGDCNAQHIKAFYLTDTRAIDAYLKKGPAVDWSAPEKAAPFLVQLVIEAGTPGVAPPIDVLRIDRSGASWIERKEQCAETGTPSPAPKP